MDADKTEPNEAQEPIQLIAIVTDEFLEQVRQARIEIESDLDDDT